MALLGETQSADAVNDAALIMWIFKASNPRLFEVLTVKAVRIVGADTFYRFQVRRGRFGTARLSFDVGDRVFVLRRVNLVTYRHGRFGAYAVRRTATTFRLQASNPWAQADLADPAACPDRAFIFADPYSPTVTWVALQKRLPPSLTWSDLTDFTAVCDPATEFRLTVHLEDPTGDLASVTIQASIGTVSVPLFNGPVTGRAAEVVSVFTLGDGDWNVVARVVDQSGRATEVGLTAIGGSSVVTLQVHAAGTTQMANPVATPRAGFYDARPNVVLTCSSAGAEVRYSIVAWGAAPGTFSIYSAPISMPLNHTLHAYAVDVVGSAESSDVVRHDYRLVPYAESGY